MSETKAPFHTPIAIVLTINKDGYELLAQPSPVLRGWSQPLGVVIEKDHAEFIVRAVNTHADLVEALEMVRDADEDCKRDDLQTIPPIARAKIDAALAKARGEQP